MQRIMNEFSLIEEGGNKDWRITGTDLADRVSCLSTRSDVFVFPVVINLVAVAFYALYVICWCKCICNCDFWVSRLFYSTKILFTKLSVSKIFYRA